MKSFSFLFALAMLVLASCGHEKPRTEMISSFNIDSVKTQIAANNAKYGGYFGTNDSVGFVSSYTADACLYPPNMEGICSTKSIGMFFSGGYKMGIRDLKITTEEVFGGQDAVVEKGKFEMIGSDGKTWDKGKFIVIWKEENGKWKMYRDIFNSDLPSAAPPTK